MPLILSGNVATAIGGAYEVANSCRFNRADSPKHEKSLGTSTNDKKHTFSCWFKKCENSVSSSEHGLMNSTTDGNNFVNCMFHSTDRFQYYSKIGGSEAMFLRPNAVFRDHSAWYHIVVGVDTSQAVAANRVKMYINGTQVTSWHTETYPDQNAVLDTNESGAAIQIGCMKGPAHYFHGYMAEVVFIDGTQYAASDFGEFDEDSPQIWKPKDVSGLTFGTNGFYLDFEDSSNLGNDVNGGTDLTETNLAATDQTSDTCTNNFATLNSLDTYYVQGTLSEGNCKYVGTNEKYDFVMSTIMPTAGKWYCEAKYLAGNSDNGIVGISGDSMLALQDYLGEYAGHIGYIGNGGRSIVGGTFTSNFTAYTHDDIIGMAMDLDNMKMYFAKNGTWGNSGDPTTGATGTGAITIQALSTVQHNAYGFAVCSFDSDDADEWFINFGNPPYANSSSAADANGYGDFEYAPPSGYLALCTKNLGSTGG